MFSLFGSPFVEDPWALQRQRAAAEEAKRRRLMAQRQAQAQAAYEQQLRAEAARRRQLQQQRLEQQRLEQQRQQEAYAEYLRRLRREQMTMADDDDDVDATPEPMVCHQPFCDCRSRSSTRAAKHRLQQTSPSAARRRPATASSPKMASASTASAVPVARPKTATGLSPAAARREQLLTVKRVRAAQMLRATNAARKIQRWFRACRSERAAAQAAAEQDRRQTAAATITAFVARLVAARQAWRVLDSLRELRDKDATMDRAMADYRAEYDDTEDQDETTTSSATTSSASSLPSPMQEEEEEDSSSRQEEDEDEDEEVEVLASLFDEDEDDNTESDKQPTAPRMPRGKAALLLVEQLERLLISLDTVESHGNAFVRAQRKALVKKANRYLAELDRVKTRPALEVDMNGHLLCPSP